MFQFYIHNNNISIAIVTTRMDFSKEICGKAAIYYEPLSYKDAALKLEKLFSNELIKEKLISLGYKQLKKFPTHKKKEFKYSLICLRKY